MPILISLDVMLAKGKMSLVELSKRTGIAVNNLSIIKTGKAKAVRFSTLEAICTALECQPGDLMEIVDEGTRQKESGERERRKRVEKEKKLEDFCIKDL